MRLFAAASLALLLTLPGCRESDTAAPTTDTPPSAAPDASLGESTDSAAAMDDDAIPQGGIALTPDNTTIQFVGTHADPQKPDPRTGKFAQFSGSAVVEESALKSVSVEIDTASLTTDIEKLTNHLKSPDFFSVNEHPKATFTSTSIEAGENGMVTITGDLTLHGETKSISFPASVSAAGGLKLNAEFTIDRTEFGMDYGTDNVLKEVQLTVTVDA